jgi:hypothetical protein
MKEIKLIKGLSALVDDDDFDYLNQYKWYYSDGYAITSVKIDEKWTSLLMHRIIMNTPKELQVDHIDHNRLNNQRSNLRNCSCAENRRNLVPRGKSKYLGVVSRHDGITAFIRNGGKKLYLGAFKTEEAAAKAYDEAAKKYHGEFANLNFK